MIYGRNQAYVFPQLVSFSDDIIHRLMSHVAGIYGETSAHVRGYNAAQLLCNGYVNVEIPPAVGIVAENVEIQEDNQQQPAVPVLNADVANWVRRIEGSFERRCGASAAMLVEWCAHRRVGAPVPLNAADAARLAAARAARSLSLLPFQ